MKVLRRLSQSVLISPSAHPLFCRPRGLCTSFLCLGERQLAPSLTFVFPDPVWNTILTSHPRPIFPCSEFLLGTIILENTYCIIYLVHCLSGGLTNPQCKLPKGRDLRFVHCCIPGAQTRNWPLAVFRVCGATVVSTHTRRLGLAFSEGFLVEYTQRAEFRRGISRNFLNVR